jgi:hypothetical protein
MLRFWKKQVNEAEVEAIANRNLFEAVAALTLKYTQDHATALLTASRQIRGLCDDTIRKADKTKKLTRRGRLMTAWRTLTGLDTLERELELERNRSVQALRLVAEQLKHLGETGVHRHEFHAACLLKARDLQAAAAQLSGIDRDTVTQAAISVTQMAMRFREPTTTDEGCTSASTDSTQ